MIIPADDMALAEDLVPPEDDCDQSVLTKLKLGVSLPASLAAGLPALTQTQTEVVPGLPKTVSEDASELSKLETSLTDQMQHNLPRVNPGSLQALETLLGVWAFGVFVRICLDAQSWIV